MASEQSAYIAGVGQTEFKRHGGIMDRSQFQVAAEAVLAALADAGMTPETWTALRLFPTTPTRRR